MNSEVMRNFQWISWMPLLLFVHVPAESGTIQSSGSSSTSVPSLAHKRLGADEEGCAKMSSWALDISLAFSPITCRVITS